MNFPAPGSRDAPSDIAPSRRRGWGARVIAVSFGISAVLNLLVVVLYPLLFDDVVVPPGGAGSTAGEVRPPGIEVVRITEVAASDPEAPEEPEVVEQIPEEPQPPEEVSDVTPLPETLPEADAGVADEPADAGSPRSAAERLRPPEKGDPRIWRPVDPSLAELTPEERARLRIYGRLDQLADSLLTEEERARRGREWVYTDDEGRRWGFTPGQIHLGDYSIPFSIGGAPSVDDQLRQLEWDGVARGTENGRILDEIEDRGEAIRERRDAERADSAGSQ